jgi:hypothetical protein
MWGFLGDLIYAVARIWRTDSEMRDSGGLTTGSEFDKQSRRFVARVCGGTIILLLVASLLWYWLTRSK